jgi:hypothetical protein
MVGSKPVKVRKESEGCSIEKGIEHLKIKIK